MPSSFSSVFKDSLAFLRHHFNIIIPIVLMISVTSLCLDERILSYIIIEFASHFAFINDQNNVKIILYYIYVILSCELIWITFATVIWQLTTFSHFCIETVILKMTKLLIPVLVITLISIPYFCGLFYLYSKGGLLSYFYEILRHFLAPEHYYSPFYYFLTRMGDPLFIGNLPFLVICNLVLFYVLNHPDASVFKGLVAVLGFVKKQYKKILPMLGLWIGVKFTLDYAAFYATLQIPNRMNIDDRIARPFIDVPFDIFTVIVYFFLVIYLYRLYALSEHQV